MFSSWIGDINNPCMSISLNSEKIDNKIFCISQTGNDILFSTKILADLNLGFSKLNCGTAYFSSEEIQNSNGYYVKCKYPNEIVIKNSNNSKINNTFLLTTYFYKNRPTYKSKDGIEIRFDDNKNCWIIRNIQDNETYEYVNNKKLKNKIDFKNYLEIPYDNKPYVNENLGLVVTFPCNDISGLLKLNKEMWGNNCLPYEIKIFDGNHCTNHVVCTRELKNYTEEEIFYSYETFNFVGTFKKEIYGYSVELLTNNFNYNDN